MSKYIYDEIYDDFADVKFDFEENNIVEKDPLLNDMRPINEVIITLTKNNTFITLCELNYKLVALNILQKKGRILARTCAGLCGFKGKDKSSSVANRTIGELTALKFKEFGLNHLTLRIYGTDERLDEIVKGLLTHGLAIDNIEENTPIPHNGPRPKKKRRK